MNAALHLLWALIFAGLAGFFLIAGGRFVARGYRLLAAALACSAATCLLNALASSAGPGLIALLAARISLVFGLFAGAINCRFLLVYCSENLRWLQWATLVLALGGTLACGVSTIVELPNVSRLAYPLGYQSPSGAFSMFLLLAFGGYFLSYAWILARAARVVRGALPLLVTVLALAPATLADIWTTYYLGHKWFLAEAGTWFYVLVVLSSLLTEVEGTKGLLKKTTSSLAERTAELEISYAELDLMHNELTRKQQLAAVGELAASIAHEVRNPLAIIMNAVSGMRRRTISEKDQATLLSIVDEEAERLNHLVSELLRFARPVTASRGPASLLDICQQTSETPPEGVELRVRTHEGESSAPVMVDPGLFRLALDNLIANSSQAMAPGGTVELCLRHGRFADGTRAAVVDVIDTGCGMKAQDLERARKPFFTTKPRGTGLGLPIVEKIVEAHGGEMEMTSMVGQGTTVSIKLPVELHEPSLASAYPGSKHPSTRRRFRTLPPGSSEAQSGAKKTEDNA